MGVGTGIGAALSSRAIIGRFYQTLGAAAVPSWLGPLTFRVDSNVETESYKWLGMTPAMREWVGGRQAKGFRLEGMDVRNKLYEATLKVSVDDMRRDKTGQIMTRVDELAVRAAQHPAKLLSDLIIAGEDTTCYDGQYFFHTGHVSGSSGTLSNDLAYDISDNTASTEDGGTATAPSAYTIQKAVLQAVQAMYGFKDDQGEPMNEDAASFLVMVPTPFMSATAAALSLPLIGGTSNLLTQNPGFSLRMAVNPRLTWTTKFAVFRADGQVKPFVDQVEFEPTMDAVAEGSELEFKEREHHYGVTASRAMAYGYWQHACLVTLAA